MNWIEGDKVTIKFDNKGWHPLIKAIPVIIICIIIFIIISSIFNFWPEESKPHNMREFWSDYDNNNGNFRSYNNGDVVIIEDYIDEIIYPKTNELKIDTPFTNNYYSKNGDILNEDIEIINNLYNDSTYIKFKSGWKDSIRGNLTSDFQKGDKVKINVHIIEMSEINKEEFVEEAFFECSDGVNYAKVPFERSCIQFLGNNIQPIEESATHEGESPSTISDDGNFWNDWEKLLFWGVIAGIIAGLILLPIRKRFFKNNTD